MFVDVIGIKRIDSASLRWRTSYKDKGALGLEDTRSLNSGRTLNRELTIEEIIAKKDAEIEYLKAELELIKKLELQERQVINKKIPASKIFKNGYYVNITAIFIDIFGSSDMTDEHKRPTIAKMYRAFLSECVAIMNSEDNCKEISINGDCVWGVFNTPSKLDINNVICVSAKLNSMVKILNYKLRKKGYSEISIGIGIDYGRALMVKAGYSGSKINDVI